MNKILKIGTRDSQLALYQANTVKDLLEKQGVQSELIYIKSEGDIDLKTPLYEMGVQGIFTRSLDIALLNSRIDIAVHSMKDVPTQLPNGIAQAAVLKRASYKDLLVLKGELTEVSEVLGLDNGQWLDCSNRQPATGNRQLSMATSSIRRKAQWLNRYPNHTIENLRGNVNTRLQKLNDSNWSGAIFAAAGLERIHLRPKNSIELDWMLPAPAQGAIMVVCRTNDEFALTACYNFNDDETAACTKIEKDFLRTLLGGCSTPISALAQIIGNEIHFEGNILSIDGREKEEIKKIVHINNSTDLGITAAKELLANGGQHIADKINNAK